MSEKIRKQLSIVAAVSAAVLVIAAAAFAALFWPRAGEASGEAAVPDPWVCPIDKEFNKWQCDQVMKDHPGYISEEAARKNSGPLPGDEGFVASYNTCTGPDASGFVTCEGSDGWDVFYIGKVYLGGIFEWIGICHNGGTLYTFSPSAVSWIKVLLYDGDDTVKVITTDYGLCGSRYLYAFKSSWPTRLEAWGHDGDDVIIGGPNSDNLHGENNNDWIHGKEGGDLLYGDYGNDTIFCGPGVDQANGYWGNDRFYCGAEYGGSGYDYIYGGNNYDSYYASDDGSYMFDASATASGNEFYGGAGVDKIYGDDGPDFILGQEGADQIRGLGGDDEIWADPNDLNVGWDETILEGGAGNDLIVGGGGADTIKGGAGNDCLVGDYLNPQNYEMGGERNDIIWGEGGGEADGSDCVYCDNAWFYEYWPEHCEAYDSAQGSYIDVAHECAGECNHHGQCNNGAHGYCESFD